LVRDDGRRGPGIDGLYGGKAGTPAAAWTAFEMALAIAFQRVFAVSEAYGLRYGSSYAGPIVRETLKFGAASMFREDNR